jgi:hypothetical protein
MSPHLNAIEEGQYAHIIRRNLIHRPHNFQPAKSIFLHNQEFKPHFYCASPSMKYMTEPAENMLSNVIEFPTFKEDGDEQVLDAGNLCHSDLALLKKNDPFMYYSIQGIRRKADVLDQDLRMSSLSVKSHIKAGRNSASRYVKRKTRISYESYFSFSPDDIAELHGPSAKRQRPSSSDVDELLHKNFGIQPPSSGDNDRMFEDMLNMSLR